MKPLLVLPSVDDGLPLLLDGNLWGLSRGRSSDSSELDINLVLLNSPTVGAVGRRG